MKKPPEDGDVFQAHIVPAGTELIRIAIDNVGATEFANCKSPTRRFGPVHRPAHAQGCVHTLYGAESLAVALMETVFHDADIGTPIVYASDLRVHRRSVVSPTRDLRLARLDDEALKKLRVDRRQLIDTAPNEYPSTSEWAEVIHDAQGAAPFDGVVWHSRRLATGFCYALFECRVERQVDLAVTAEPVGLCQSPVYDEILALATQLGVTIVT